MDLSQIVTKIFIFLALMLTGYLLASKRAVTEEFTAQASKLTINVFGSASIINAVTTCGDASLNTLDVAIVLIVMLVMIGMSYAFAHLVVKLFRYEGEKRLNVLLLTALMNILFVGVPIAQELFGGLSVLYLGLAVIPFNFLMYTYGVYLIIGSGKEKVSLKDVVNLPMVATVAAMILVILRIDLPTPIAELAGTVSGATVPMSMIVIGSSLGRTSIFDAFKEKTVYLICLLRLIVFPVLIWLLFKGVPMDRAILQSTVLTAGCPCGVMVSVLLIEYGRDARLASKSILISTVLSMVTLPLLSLVLGL